MLSTEYRLRMEFICQRIAKQEEVKLEDMIWANKLAKANGSAGEMLRKARRLANNPGIVENSMDDFLNQMDIGNPDPTDNSADFSSAEAIAEWFLQDNPDAWRQRD